MKILIMTPDGDIGCQVVAELLSPEFTVRVITDDPANLPEEWREQVEVIAGPMDNAGTLRRALAGVGSVLWCLPSGTDQEIEPLAHALSRALRETGTPKLVTVSKADCEFNQPAGPLPDRSAVENILNKSGTAIRHLQCSPLIEALLSRGQSVTAERSFPLPGAGDTLLPLVAGDDVVDMALRYLVRQDWESVARLAVSCPRPVLF
jgi:uncharacterized protein YbjT (DUF2867 family)